LKTLEIFITGSWRHPWRHPLPGIRRRHPEQNVVPDD
jgi:hypothetical protein